MNELFSARPANPARWPFDSCPKLLVDWVSIYLLRAEKLTILRIWSCALFFGARLLHSRSCCAHNTRRDVFDHNLGRREGRAAPKKEKHNANDYTFAIRLFFIFDFLAAACESVLSSDAGPLSLSLSLFRVHSPCAADIITHRATPWNQF